MIADTNRYTYFDIGMIRIGRSKLSSTTLFLPVLVKLRLSKDGFSNTLVLQGEGRVVGKPLLILRSDWQDDGNGLIGDLR